MKSDHRHELKTNELADWLAHFPQWVQENRSTLIGAGVVLVLVIGVYFMRFYRKDVISVRQQVQLTHLVTQIPAQKMAIARAASQGTDQSVALLPIAQDLETFAEGSRDDRMAALALIKRAEALRSELHFRLAGAGGEEVARQIAQAQNSYQEALTRASSIPVLAATAEFGLGLCEEELGNFDRAKEMYRAVAQNAAYDGTAAQAGAANRLLTVDDYRGAVAFKPAPPAPEGASIPTIQIPPAEDVFFEGSEPVAPDTNSIAAPETAVGEANEPASN
ncbi:tetratricopeptide repeat protein [Anaerobaca lacustris]|uniref:Tetratricopeptide repeat-like domain-containing protein n=1 Tax=Anaerobaca lacustris TaxID=3044600 RepID=A0AAW6TVG3_9BACT|nr:hypothetical protein [Sedimentisphaerales bacterium M17dextr]